MLQRVGELIGAGLSWEAAMGLTEDEIGWVLAGIATAREEGAPARRDVTPEEYAQSKARAAAARGPWWEDND